MSVQNSLIAQFAAMDGRAIIAIDGVVAAGKTTFTDRLSALIVRQGRAVVRASVDGFHNPRAKRSARRKSDPLGYSWIPMIMMRSRLVFGTFQTGARSG